jgi:hypothetical protein
MDALCGDTHAIECLPDVFDRDRIARVPLELDRPRKVGRNEAEMVHRLHGERLVLGYEKREERLTFARANDGFTAWYVACEIPSLGEYRTSYLIMDVSVASVGCSSGYFIDWNPFTTQSRQRRPHIARRQSTRTKLRRVHARDRRHRRWGHVLRLRGLHPHRRTRRRQRRGRRRGRVVIRGRAVHLRVRRVLLRAVHPVCRPWVRHREQRRRHGFLGCGG